MDALKAVRDSEEVADLVAALRQHAGYSLKTFGDWLMESGDGKPATVTDLLARARALVQPGA